MVWGNLSTQSTYGSISAFQRRVPSRLEEYPMEISRARSQSSMADYRSTRKERFKSCNSDQIVSEDLYRYGKQMFEDAFQRAGGFPKLERNSAEQRKPTYMYAKPKAQETDLVVLEKRNPLGSFNNSGPTHLGSPIHTHGPRLMNCIRTRVPSAGLNGRYNHDRSRKYPEIQRVLQQSNSNFKAVTPAPTPMGDDNAIWLGSTCTINASDILLVPLNPEAGLTNITACSVDTQNDGGGEDQNEMETLEQELIRMANEGEEETEEMRVPKLRIQVPEELKTELQEAANGAVKDGTMHMNTLLSVDGKAQTSPGSQSPSRPTSARNNRSRPGSANRMSRPRSGRSRPSSACRKSWVDNLTVSSVGSKKAATQQDTPEAANTVGKIRLETNGHAASLKSKPMEDVPIHREGGNLDTTEPHILTLEQIDDDCYCLPDFICPSSEEKSREAFVKHWLTHTSFPVAIKSVPMI